jgi:hypothetical protein
MERHLLLSIVGPLIERSAIMKRLLFPLLAIAVAQLPAGAQPLPGFGLPSLAGAIAGGAPFVVQLNPGENNGTLLGGQTYIGRYHPDSNTFTVSGPGLRPEDGAVIPVTATYGGADPLRQQLSLWGALYTFDSRGSLFVGTSGGRLAGKVGLRR